MNRATRPLFIMAYLAAALVCPSANGETPSPSTTTPAAPQPTPSGGPATEAATPSAAAAATVPTSLAALDWLRGCWAGKVTRREFTEQWQQARGGMMLGVSQMVVGEQTLDYTYLRIESRPDGLYYIAIPSGKTELAFKLASVEVDNGAKLFTFDHSGEEFPQRIVYRLNEQGSMFAQVAGKVSGKDKQVTYPMHRVDCVTGESPRD